MNRPLNFISYIFALVGCVLFTVAFWNYSSKTSFIKNAVQAEGTVVDYTRGSGNYKPIVHFKTSRGEEIEYISSLSTNPPLFERGEIVTIYYNPNNPQDAKINEFWSLYFIGVLTGGLGTIFFSVGGGMLLYSSLRKKQAAYLQREGTRVQAKFTGVERNRMLRVNNRNPFRIICQWQDPTTSKLHIFRSENLWFDPTEYINTETLTVFVDRNNPKKHYVDISLLPKVT